MSSFSEVLSFTDALIVFGLASGVLSTIAYIPYILDTLANRTQPQRASWLIWSVLGSIAVFSQIYEGATSSLWFAGVQVSGTIIVFLLSIQRGKGKFLSKNDYYVLVAAAAGLVLWYFTENAAYALAITISISLLGGMATAVKAFYNPDSETLSTWIISFVASMCAIMSVGKLDFVLLAYPVYLFTLYFCFILAIILGRVRRSRVTLDTVLVSVARPLRSVLRITADGIVVIAGIVYLLSSGLPFQKSLSASPVESLLDNEGSLKSDNSTSHTRDWRFPADTISASLMYGSLTDAAQTQLASKVSYEQPPHYLGANGVGNASAITVPLSVTYKDTLDRPFLQLDGGDPFTQLVITAGPAALLDNLTDTEPKRFISHGTTLVALATNGDWFKVSTEIGNEGYLHRSQVSVSAPELPSAS